MTGRQGDPGTPAHTAVLVVDDEAATLSVLVRLLTVEGYEVHTAVDAESALPAIERHAPDIILLDAMLPGLDGFEVCRRIKQAPATRLTPVVMITGLGAREHRLEGINAGADDFLESAEAVILSLALTIEARDAYTDGHCQRLAGYATALGEALLLGDEDLATLYRGGFLHDLGKIAIPDAVLQKPAKLTDAEFDLMKTHTVIGERLCGNLRSLGPVRSVVRHHHERLNGTGYPDGLRGDEVPLLAQIVGIADVYDAITTSRPYRAASPADWAYEELRIDVADGLRRRDLVEAFIALGRAGQLEQRAHAVETVALS